MGPYAPPSFPAAFPQAECLEPRETDPSWTQCYILTGSPQQLCGPRDGAHWAVLTEWGERHLPLVQRGAT